MMIHYLLSKKETREEMEVSGANSCSFEVLARQAAPRRQQCVPADSAAILKSKATPWGPCCPPLGTSELNFEAAADFAGTVEAECQGVVSLKGREVGVSLVGPGWGTCCGDRDLRQEPTGSLAGLWIPGAPPCV